MASGMINSPARSKVSNEGIVVLLGCILIVALLCYVHIKGSAILIAVCLLIFLLFYTWGCGKRELLPILLFFLPWSPLMKLYNGGISFFTIALLIAGVICFWRGKFVLNTYQLILTALLVGLTMMAKVIHFNSIAANYLCFLAMLVLFPCVIKENQDAVDFWELTIFFACGIITAALSAQQVAGYPNISQYITVDSYSRITRLSGYYGDPNFYSAHITACLAGVQLLLSQERKRRHQIVLIVFSVLLIYCGLLSASKSFVIVTACLFLVWIPILLEKGNCGGKFGILMGLLCAGLIVLSSSVFQNLLQIVNYRFSNASSMSDFTTRRTELWSRYMNELIHNAPLALLGEGYSGVNLNGRASHNTVIQGIYQFGVVGFPLLCIWMYLTLKNIFFSSKAKIKWKYAALMGIGVVLPWMALDILFFDELFLLSVYAAIGIVYASNGSREAGVSEAEGCPE